MAPLHGDGQHPAFFQGLNGHGGDVLEQLHFSDETGGLQGLENHGLSVGQGNPGIAPPGEHKVEELGRNGLLQYIFPGIILHDLGVGAQIAPEIVRIGRSGEILVEQGRVFDDPHGYKIGDFSYLPPPFIEYTISAETPQNRTEHTYYTA